MTSLLLISLCAALPTRRSTRAASGDVLLKSKMQELESLEGQLAEYKESGATEGETEEYLVEQVSLSPPA